MKYLITILIAVSVTLFTQETVLADKGADKRIAAGKKLAFDRKKGNCLACHVVEDGSLPGTVAPPLMMMKARYPDREALKAQIYDARTKNKTTMMPPFGAHGILSDEDIDLITDYIHSL